MKKGSLLLIYIVLIIGLLFTGCSANKKGTTGKISVSHSKESGMISLEISIEDFNKMGFDFGDSVDVTFNNGRTIYDIPYYSGYFTEEGDLLLYGQPGDAHILLTRKDGGATWEEFGMNSNSSVTVTLNQKGKYREVQELYNMVYPESREDHDQDQTSVFHE